MALTVDTRIERFKATSSPRNPTRALIPYTIMLWGIAMLRDRDKAAEYEVILSNYARWLVDNGETAVIGQINFWHMVNEVPHPEAVYEIFMETVLGF